MRNAVQLAAEDVLLKIYDCSAKHTSDSWYLDSAFKALNRDDYEIIGREVFELMIGRGWVVANNDFFAPKLVEGDDRFNIVPDGGVTITPEGKTAAVGLIERRQPKALVEQIRNVSRSDWIAITALIVSLSVALFD